MGAQVDVNSYSVEGMPRYLLVIAPQTTEEEKSTQYMFV